MKSPGPDQRGRADLASLTSAKRAADEVATAFDRVDILINNAGIMAAPQSTTEDGYELHIGTNHLGHFAWTATLWPLLKASASRIVSVSSLMHARATGIDLRALTRDGSPAATGGGGRTRSPSSPT